MFAAFFFYIYFISNTILFQFIDLAFLPIGSIVIIICSSLLAFSFIRHRLMNINMFISRQVFYGSFTVILISSYLILVGFVGELVKFWGLSFNTLFYPVFIILSMMLFLILCFSKKNQERIKKIINRHFYNNKFDYRFEWIELTNRISSIIDLKDLSAGIVLMGTVRNVSDFGAFVDIGVHQDGLVHKSQMADRFVKHPLDIVKVGDVIKVKILEVDTKRKRIGLTMKDVE